MKRFYSICSFISILTLSSQLVAKEEKDSLPLISQETYQLLAQFYEYDRAIPLEARIVESKEVEDHLREKIVLRTTQGFLAPGYLQLPKTGTAPYPCVLLLHGWSGSKESWYQDNNYISGGNIRKALLEQGFATFALDAQCHGDRIALNDFAPINHFQDESQPKARRRKSYFTQREIYMQTVIDYRRVLDYLETRTEIDSHRIGLVGYSMGGNHCFTLTAIEPRIQATVACACPSETKPLTLYAPQNYLHGISDRPFFIVSGNNDTMCPMPHAQELYELLPTQTKDLKFYGGHHKLTPDFVPDAVQWITNHLKSDQ